MKKWSSEKKDVNTDYISVDYLTQLAELLTDYQLSAIKINGDFGKIELRREEVVSKVASSSETLSGVGNKEVMSVAGGDTEKVITGKVVKASMVGVAYLAPQSGADPFVREGDEVVAGDTLLIIEALKVMNQIKSPYSGCVKKVLFSDGEPVEYGQELMIIE